MLFNSIEFFVFFPIVTALYFLLPHRWRWALLLLASSYFYMAFIPRYILILGIVILVDYCAGLLLMRTHGRTKKMVLAASIIANVGILFFFKYWNFFNENLFSLADALHWNYPLPLMAIILPIGLSFHTFQSMSYTIEVYRENYKAERNLGIFALYVMFYPQLVAGPIERPQNLLTQLREKHNWDWQRIADGLKLMLWGLFKKVVIADRLALFVDTVFNSPAEYYGISVVLATVFFAFQIYCDFSGYCDIAIGAAEVMGFKLTDNFKRPYFAKSVADFWSRWHISLTSWFRDYIYIPLGGNRISKLRWYGNIIFVFLISGIWHGAAWTFIVWGVLNGFYIIAGLITKPVRAWTLERIGFAKFPRLYKYWQVLITFSLVCVGWIFFRAESLNAAVSLLKNITTGWGNLFANLGSSDFLSTNIYLGQPSREFLIAILAISFMEAIHSIQRHTSIRHMLLKKPAWIRLFAYGGMVLFILFFGIFSNQPFIYFQF